MVEKRTAFAAVCDGAFFGIGLAEEGERGYFPQAGFGHFGTYDEARIKADELNAQLGLDKMDAAMIVAGSMRSQNTRKKVK